MVFESVSFKNVICLGLILDARAAPLALPRRSEDRRAVLAGWRDTILREPAQPAAVAT